MARTKKRSKRVSGKAAAERSNDGALEQSAETADATPAPAFLSKRVWLSVLAVAVTWWMFLLVTAWRTANPVTLNQRQIAESRYVVTGKVASLETGIVEVEREWKRDEPLESISVENLRQANAEEGETYLIPLAAERNDVYRVTESPVEGAPPPIYPVSPESIEQLEAILQQIAERRKR